MNSIDNKLELEPRILTASAEGYIKNHPDKKYDWQEISSQDVKYETCVDNLRKQAREKGAEVVTDAKEAISAKPDEYRPGFFEFFVSMRGTALIPLNKEDALKEDKPKAFSTL